MTCCHFCNELIEGDEAPVTIHYGLATTVAHRDCALAEVTAGDLRPSQDDFTLPRQDPKA